MLSRPQAREVLQSTVSHILLEAPPLGFLQKDLETPSIRNVDIVRRSILDIGDTLSLTETHQRGDFSHIWRICRARGKSA